MENASKALIIAGAILLAILLISLGIMVFNQANSLVGNNAMTEVDITTHNQKFTNYEGKNVRGSTVRSMLQPILSNNIAADSDDRKVQVFLNKDGKTETILEKNSKDPQHVSDIETGSSYTVECGYSPARISR